MKASLSFLPSLPPCLLQLHAQPFCCPICIPNGLGAMDSWAGGPHLTWHGSAAHPSNCFCDWSAVGGSMDYFPRDGCCWRPWTCLWMLRVGLRLGRRRLSGRTGACRAVSGFCPVTNAERWWRRQSALASPAQSHWVNTAAQKKRKKKTINQARTFIQTGSNWKTSVHKVSLLAALCLSIHLFQ